MRRTCAGWQSRSQIVWRNAILPLRHSCQHASYSDAAGNQTHEAARKRSWLQLVVGLSGGAACGGFAAIGLGLGNPSDGSSSADSTYQLATPLTSSSQAPSWVSTISSQPSVVSALHLDNASSHKGSLSADHWVCPQLRKTASLGFCSYIVCTRSYAMIGKSQVHMMRYR